MYCSQNWLSDSDYLGFPPSNWTVFRHGHRVEGDRFTWGDRYFLYERPDEGFSLRKLALHEKLAHLLCVGRNLCIVQTRRTVCKGRPRFLVRSCQGDLNCSINVTPGAFLILASIPSRVPLVESTLPMTLLDKPDKL